MRGISRRTLLATAAAIGGSGGLAGCSAFRDDEPAQQETNESPASTPGAVVWRNSDGEARAEYRDGESVTDSDAAAVIQSVLDAVGEGDDRPAVVEVEGAFDLAERVEVPGETILDLTGARLATTGDYAPISVGGVADVTVVGGVLDGAEQTDEEEFLGVVSLNRAERVTLVGTEAINGGYYGVNLYECNDCLLYGVRARNNYRVGFHPGTDTEGWGIGNVLVSCVAEDTTLDGINDRGSTVSGVDPGNVYVNCLSRNNGANGFLFGSGDTEEDPATTHHAIGCRAFDNDQNGMVVSGSRASLVHPTAENNGGSGVWVRGATDVTLLSPAIRGNTGQNAGGVKITGYEGVSPSNIVVSGGHVRQNWINLFVTSGIPVTGVTYRDVDARGAESQHVAFYGDGEKREITIDNVRGYQTRNRGQVTREADGSADSFDWEHDLAGAPAAVDVQAASAAAVGDYYVNADDETIAVTYSEPPGDDSGDGGESDSGGGEGSDGNELRWWWRADLY